MGDWDIESTKPSAPGGGWEVESMSPMEVASKVASGIGDFSKQSVIGAAEGVFNSSPVGLTLDSLKRSAQQYSTAFPDALGAETAGKLAQVPHELAKKYIPKPEGMVGEYGHTMGEFAIGSVAPVGQGTTMLRRALNQTVIPALTSETAGQATKGTEAEPWARLATSVAAPIVAERVVTPFTGRLNKAAATAVLRNEGVTDVSAGQALGHERLKYAESEMAGPSMQRMVDSQLQQYTRAAFRRAGENEVMQGTPEVIDRTLTRIGGDFDRLSAGNAVYAPMITATAPRRLQAVTNYQRRTGPNERVPIVEDMISDLNHHLSVHGGQLPGDVYQAFRSNIGKEARVLSGNEKAQNALYEIQGSLDDAMERSIRQFNPSQLGEWQRARREYRNFLVLERALGYSGEGPASGLITPSNLERAVKSLQGVRAYVRGQGDFNELAHAGREVLTSVPQSGTTPRAKIHAIVAALTAAATAGGTGHASPGALAAAGAAGLVLPRIVGEVMISPPVRRWLGNSALPRNWHDTTTGAAMRAYMASRQAREGLE